MPTFPVSRGRRIRNSNWIRTLTTENYLTTDDLVAETEKNPNDVDNPTSDTIKEIKEETPIESNSKSSSKISNI